MRYCFISDIHGNLEAFTAVLDAAAKEHVDKYICLGDVVGYGADPSRCIEMVRSLKPDALIAGNHEWGVLDLFDINYFNEYAAKAVEWTKKKLSKDEIGYLAQFELVREDDNMTLVHGSMEMPQEFNYILNKGDAYITMNIMKTPVCFVGHSHVAGIFADEGGKAEFLELPRIKMEARRKYVVNVGSIGQPRDGDPRASFAVYDDGSGVVEIKRVAYDVESAKNKILKAGLPDFLAYRLLEGK